MKKMFFENRYLIFLWILCVIGFLFFYGHYSGILIDFGREVYYPEQILEGKVLFKDIFNIYGPLSYQINAIFYWLFGNKLETLYGLGFICSVSVVSGIFLVARKFLSEFLSFCIGFFTICVGVTTTSIFNYHFPYSWAVLYGLVSFLFSLFFLLKYKENNNSNFLAINSFLAGVCITSKYDFLLYGFIVLFFIIKSKDIKALLSFLAAPVISFGILFAQGLNFSNISDSLNIIKLMAKSKTLEFFYQNSGIYFHPKALPVIIGLFLKFIIPFSAILGGAYLFEKNKLASVILSFLGYITFIWFYTANVKVAFGFLPIFFVIFSIASFKKFNGKLLILSLSAIAVSAKVFWILIIQSYGSYYVPILLVAFLALLFCYIPSKLQKISGIYLLIAGLFLLIGNINLLSVTDYKISTQKGTIYTQKSFANSTNQLIEYLKTTNGNAVIFPEGMTVNFLADKKADDFYNSLLPLYIETFGEDKIIEHYKKTKPEYIIFNNLNMKDYYFNYICQDYALKFCGFVKKNYELEQVIDNGFRYIIFKRK